VLDACELHLVERTLPKENDLEGTQDQGGKHGGQAGLPKSPPRPDASREDEDEIRKRGTTRGPGRKSHL